MLSRIDKAGHTKAFDYPVAEHWGESRNVQFRRWDSNRCAAGSSAMFSVTDVLSLYMKQLRTYETFRPGGEDSIGIFLSGGPGGHCPP